MECFLFGYFTIEVGRLPITVIRKYVVVLGSQLVRIFPDLDRWVDDEEQLHAVHLLKTVLNTKFKTLVSTTLEVKRVEDAGDNGL